MRPSRRAPNAVLLAVAACLISAATAEELGELGEGSCVSSLDTGSFEAAIRGKNALVVFFAPWCGHCKALHPHFERLCTDLSDQEDFLAAVVDATEEVQLAESHGVTGMRRRVSQSTHARADTECCAATGRLSDHRLVRQARVLRPHRRSLQRRPLGGGNAGLCQLQDRLGRCSRRWAQPEGGAGQDHGRARQGMGDPLTTPRASHRARAGDGPRNSAGDVRQPNSRGRED